MANGAGAANTAIGSAEAQVYPPPSNYDGAPDSHYEGPGGENGSKDEWSVETYLPPWADAIMHATQAWLATVSGLTWDGRPIPTLQGVQVTPDQLAAIENEIVNEGLAAPAAAPAPQPTFGTDASACQGHAHCVIFVDGVDIQGHGGALGFNTDKTQNGLNIQEQSWTQWEEYYSQKYGGDVGFVFMEAPDADQGADEINKQLQQLQQLSGDGEFGGTVSLVGHSNGAASVFHYMAEAQRGHYKGDHSIQSFVALDAPDATVQQPWNPIDWDWREAVAGWSHWDPAQRQADMEAAAQYVKSQQIKGVYAFDPNDPFSGSLTEGVNGKPPWQVYQSQTGKEKSFNFDDPSNDTHLRLQQDPDSDPNEGIEKAVDSLP